MRRLMVVGALVSVGVLVLRGRLPQLQERLAAHCGAMFERMPDTFPPKTMLRGIEELRVRTARIQELLEGTPGGAAEAKVAERVAPLPTASPG